MAHKRRRARKQYNPVQLTAEEVVRFHLHVPNQPPPPRRTVRQHHDVNPFHEGIHEVMRGNHHNSRGYLCGIARDGHPHVSEVASDVGFQKEAARKATFERRMKQFWIRQGENVVDSE